MSTRSSSARTIVDIPDEILVKIISYLNARNRLPLAEFCPKFHSLVFEDEELTRVLDFSKKGHLTTAKDIRQYFDNIKTRKLVRKVNVQNVICMKPGRMLNNSIGKGINLVDINVHGTEFKDIKQLASFLEPLIHLKRLSVDWPKSKNNDFQMCSRFLQATLGRLTYFSVKVYVTSVEFLPNFKLCQDLEELRMVTKRCTEYINFSCNVELNKLNNLKIVQVRGWESKQIKNNLIDMLLDVKEWTDFQLIDISREPGFYFEKNVEVCKELQERKLMKRAVNQQKNIVPKFVDRMGLFLLPEYLLTEIIRITHKDAPQTFCCLPRTLESFEEDRQHCLLKIDEAKQLLKDPGYQISFLQFRHNIEPDCDAHLVASAFPNLTELVLGHIIKSNDTVSTSRMKTDFQRCLGRRNSSIIEEQNDLTNPDSSFKMLVDNTPHLRDLTIYAEHVERIGRERWDLDALFLIPRWKNLTTLRLVYVPINDGRFLIDIGKECAKLETLVLHHLRGWSRFCNYTIELAQMLNCCENLRELSIEEFHIDNMSGIFTSLFHISNLRRLNLVNASAFSKYDELKELILCVKELLRRCPKLTALKLINPEDSEELESALKRIRVELNRPNLQFQTTPTYRLDDTYIWSYPETVYKDAPLFFFPRKFDGLLE